MKKSLVVIQEEISDCGVCSLLSIIRYYGGNISLENLRIDSLTTKEGVNAYNLIECAKKNGFDARGVKDIPLNIIKLPCIAHININKSLSHFIVIYKVGENELYVMDPSLGFKTLKMCDFNNISTGIYIELVPKQKLEYIKTNKTAEQKFKKNLKNNKYSLLKIIILNILFLIFSVISSLYINILNNIEDIIILSVIFIATNVMTYYLSYKINTLVVKLNTKINFELIKEFLKHIFNLPLKYIHMKDKNEIIKRVEEIEVVNNLICITIINSIINLMILLSIVIIEVVIFIYCLIPIILLIFTSITLTILSLKKIKLLINESIDKSTNYRSSLISYISKINSIYHSSSINAHLDILNKNLESYLKTNEKHDNYLCLIETLKAGLSSSFLLISNILLLYFIVNDNLPINYVFIINYLNNILSNSIDNISNSISNYYYYKSVSTKVNEFYNVDEIRNSNKIKRNDFNSIRFKNVYFSFNIFNKILNNVNFEINKGEKILLRGPSGCGKSTILKIISKEYSDYQGIIKIGNTNLKNINPQDLFQHLYYSSQNEEIFMDTIKNNITMYHPTNDNELNKIIEITNLDRVISKKAFGINTFLYGGGEELSGGEKQLILLARALLSNKDIIILDESLSEVNESIENAIIDNIIKNYCDNIIIYVSHKQNKNYPMRIINMEERSNNGNTKK